MHATPIAAKPPDGDRMAERSHCESPFADVRLCIHGADGLSAEHLESLRRRLPSSARLCVFGTHAAWPGVEHCPIGPEEGRDPLAVLAAAAAAFPQEHLILVRADLDLPPFACERLLRALQADGVLGALPLDERRLDPSRHGVLRTAAEYAIDAVRLDALCYAVAERRLDEDAHFPRNVPALSAWHGARLAGLGTQALRHADALDAAGLSVVQLDHLYVESGAPPGSDDEDAAPSPLALLRERLAAAIRADLVPALPGLDGRPVLLHVLHGWGGGAERWVRDYAAADTAAHHLVLIARGRFASRRHGEWLELHDGAMQGPPLRRWPLPRPIADTALGDATYRRLFADVVRDFCVDGIVVSSLIGHSLDALRSALPTVAVVHDHYPLWPMLHRNFGDPALAFDAAQLAADLAANGKDAEFADRDPAHWRHLRDATVDALRNANATLAAPSRSALANHLRLAPELAALRAEIVPHGLAAWPAGAPTEAPPPRERLRLLVPGRIRRGKGAELLRAALPRLREHAELFLLGAGSDAHDLFGESSLHVVLDYRRDEFPALLARIRPDAALLLPTVAETFSYMLSELRSLGLPVVATRVGALAERIEDGVDGFLVDTDVEAIAACIERLAREPAAIGAVRANLVGFPHATTAETAQRYTRLLDLPRRASARYPLAMTGADSLLEAALASELARASARERTIRAELLAARSESERRGEWGHGLDRELAATRSRLTRLNEAHDALHDELKQRTDWALALDAELQGVKPHYEQILASSSWRLTAPLRAGKNRLRALRASLAYRTLHLRSLAGRLRGSLAQRGLAGTLKRVAQEFRRSGPAQARLTYAEPTDDFAPFALPTSETPRVSIIVPVYNKIAYTGACLRSIAEQAGPTPFEVIVVDDGSTDATAQRLAGIAGLRLLRNERNLGFIGSCNAGAAAARGDCVLFLNNDTVVTEGWLEALVRCLEEAPDAGLVGAKLVYPDGRLQEAGGIVFDDGSGWNYGRFEDPTDTRYNFRREADYCSGAAILLRRDLFESLGAFDRRYAPAYYEDTDLAFAVRAAGLKVYYEPAATVVHFEGITSGTDTASGTKRYQVVNREKFLDKWKDALARQPRPGTPIGIAATHRARKRVLIVDATTPAPDQDSGSLRMVNLMRVLADLGCQTSFLPENRAWIERYTAQLQELGVEALYAPYAQDPVRLLRERGAEFDLVVLSRHYVAASYLGLVRLYAPKARLAFDTVDLHYLRERRAAELEGRPELARHAETTRAQELKLIRECDVTLVVSPVEQELLAREVPGARVEVLSNVHEIYGCRRPYAERRDLVFVGGFQHPPNTDAVEWFVREVFPHVCAELPDARFHVIGSKAPDSIRALAGDRVVVHGYVEDIAPYMDGCRLSVAPLRYGAGVKGKVNMAMSYGLPVVATSPAVEGMHVVPGGDVLVADEPFAFAAAVVRLYRDETLWNRLSKNGLANVERHFSFDAARTALRGLLA